MQQFTLLVILIVVHGIFIVKVQPKKQATIKELEATCSRMDINCVEGPYCFGYNIENAMLGETFDPLNPKIPPDCSDLPKQCTHGFGVIRRGQKGNYKLQLVSRHKGWIGIIFSTKVGLIEGARVGVACVKGAKPEVQFIDISTISTISKSPIKLAGADKGLSGGSIKKEGDPYICEFELFEDLTITKPKFQLFKAQFKLGIIGHDTENLVTGQKDKIVNQNYIVSASAVMDAFALLRSTAASSTKADYRFLVIYLWYLVYHYYYYYYYYY